MLVPLPDTAKASIHPHFFPAYTVSQADDRTVFVCLMNTPTNDFQLQASQKIGGLCSVVETLEHPPPLNSSQCSYVASSFGVKDNTNIALKLEENISSNLNASDKHIILQTLLEFSDVFDETLGHTDVIQHHIDTGSALPILQYPRRLPYAYREETNQQVTDMHQQGLFSPVIVYGLHLYY